MHPRPVSLLLALALAGCAATGADHLPVCDGLHRRPANASALPASAALSAPPGGGVELAASDAPCGTRS